MSPVTGVSKLSWHRLRPHRGVLLLVPATLFLFLVPTFLAPYPLVILCHMLVFAIACLAWNLVYGTTGLLSLGHATYFGAGAYAGAFVYRFSDVQSFELYLLSGVLASTALATILGFLCVRTTRIFFAILTLALSMIVYSLVIDGAVFRLFGPLGWALYLLGGGSMYLPRLTILGALIPPAEFVGVFYRVIVIAFSASVLLLWRISLSPFGRALTAIRDNETRAAFVGIPVWRYRWGAFILSGFFMGLAGCLYGQLARQITPEQLYWIFSANLVLATVVGGSRYFAGPILGAAAFIALEEFASQWIYGRNLAMGVLLIVAIRAFPDGVAGRLAALWRRMTKGQS